MTNPASSGLPDYLAPGLRILFVGINPGLHSARLGHHFAGPSNRFWKLLSDSKLLPTPMNFRDDWRLPEWGFGLTNLIARPTAGLHHLCRNDFHAGRTALLQKIRRYRPGLLALLGITIAKYLLLPTNGHMSEGRRGETKMRPGLQSLRLSGTPVFVLPNPSGRNARYPYPEMLRLFKTLRQLTAAEL
jgi:double-stranded uracil-DNA glycosylase